MQILKERPLIDNSASVLRISPVQLAPGLRVKARKNASHRTPGLALAMGKRALLKIYGGISRFGTVLSGPPMSERDRFQYAATSFKIQQHRAIAANLPQCPSR